MLICACEQLIYSRLIILIQTEVERPHCQTEMPLGASVIKNLLTVVILSLQGWIFNVIPWLVAIPSSLFSGCLSDHLISQG